MNEDRKENKILFYRWGALGETAFIDTINKSGFQCVVFSQNLQDYHADGAFAEAMLSCIHNNQVRAVFSYDYFPIISMLCNMNQIPYMSWIYDCPMNTLMSQTLQNECNYIFCFDALYTDKLCQLGAVHAFHCPLAIDEGLLEKVLKAERENQEIFVKYQNEISFVGNLYNDDKNRIRKASFSQYSKGFIEGLIKSQMLIYGYNFLADSLQPKVTEEIVEKCNLKLGENYICSSLQMAADAVGIEVTARERKQVLCLLSDRYGVTLYTGSRLEEDIRGRYLKVKGHVDYEQEMPFVFHNSRINLNITSRTIQSGIPQRVLDILACQGFCLTNYQPEIAEYFVDGEELVMYTGMEDLLGKVDYYLTHEEERQRIAEKGYEKVIREFSLKERLAQMMEVL